MNTKRKYTKEALEVVAPDCDSIADVMRALEVKASGSTYNLISQRLREYEIDTSHFTGQNWRKGKTFSDEFKGANYYLVRLEPGSKRTGAKYLRKALEEIGREFVCVNGHPAEWMGKALRLHVDHIDGDWYNNTRENLRYLCPNCHDQTETWGRVKMAL